MCKHTKATHFVSDSPIRTDNKEISTPFLCQIIHAPFQNSQTIHSMCVFNKAKTHGFKGACCNSNNSSIAIIWSILCAKFMCLLCSYKIVYLCTVFVLHSHLLLQMWWAGLLYQKPAWNVTCCQFKKSFTLQTRWLLLYIMPLFPQLLQKAEVLSISVST